ncbi:hypothetical protein [Aureimonas sp. SK2]|uniref:hypothetical protein n=1 Tax=Aureimonas sp. SK2 TaxID=3015992 RepID=UPI002444A33C|nr:hypothetical protein [Aureimonas sp. SK2]
MRLSPHPDGLRDRAAELERMARDLRQIADGDWPPAHEGFRLDDWALSARPVDALVGIRSGSGKRIVTPQLLVLDEERGLARCTHRTWTLGRKSEGDA